MDEESSQNFDFEPINSKCPTNVITQTNNNDASSKNNAALDKTSAQASIDSSNDQDVPVGSLYGGNIYGLKNYEIIYKKKKINIKTFNIKDALLHIINSLNINKDCLFQITEINSKKNISSIYHFKNNKRKIINKIR